MNDWLVELFFTLYLVEVNVSSVLSFWLSSLWPSSFSASYFSCDFFFLTMSTVRRSRRVKAAMAPTTIGRTSLSISAPKASCLLKSRCFNFGSDKQDAKKFLGKEANNQNGNLRWFSPLGVGPPPHSSAAPAADCQLFSHVQSHLNYYT